MANVRLFKCFAIDGNIQAGSYICDYEHYAIDENVQQYMWLKKQYASDVSSTNMWLYMHDAIDVNTQVIMRRLKQ